MDRWNNRRPYPVLLVLLVGLFVFTSAHANRADPEQARTALDAGNFAQAINLSDDILRNDPNNLAALFVKGRALARSGDTGKALRIFEAAAASQPGVAEAWNNVGRLRAREGKLDDALTALNQAVSIKPDYELAQRNLGEVYTALANRAFDKVNRLATGNMAAGHGVKSAQDTALGLDPASGLFAAHKTNGRQTERDAGSKNTERNAGRKSNVVIDTSTPQATVKSWAKAWSAQDADAYLKLYSDHFQSSGGQTWAAWAADRRKRLEAPKYIKITLSNARMSRRTDQALVLVNQRYQTDTTREDEQNSLLLENTSKGWKILREGKAGSVYFTDSSSGTKQSGSANKRVASATTQMTDRLRVRSEIRGALETWAGAWSAQDVNGYLQAYSAEFRPADGRSIGEWRKLRRRRLQAPASIRVSLNNMDINILSATRATATFEQHYVSDSYEDRERKKLTLVKERNGWRINREN